MPLQLINVGSAPDDGTGDPFRDAFDKCNDNFTELYAEDASLDGRVTALEGASGITELDDIPDVNAPTPSNGDVLTWDSTPGEWVAAAPTGGSNALDDLTDVDAPTPSDGDVLTFDSGSGDWVPAAPSGGGTSSGTSFPGSPSTDDLFYRTDRRIEYFYDGTRWLSTQLFTLPMTSIFGGGLTADGNGGRAAVPFFGTYSLYIISVDYVSLLTATAIWNLNLNYSDSANAQTLIATRSTSGDAANTWVNATVAVGSVLSANARELTLLPDETTGSATYFGSINVNYRLVG